MSESVYLVSGANRGIGLSLVASILEKHPDAVVYAGVRNPDTAFDLKELEGKYTGRISVHRFVSADVEGNATLAKEIEIGHGRVDTVIANAAISDSPGTVLETTLETFQDHYRINVFGPLVLFQAMYSLLQKSKKPRFIAISSGAASLDGVVVRQPEVGHSAYGSSKAALNWVTRKMHFENEWLVAFPLNPGPVKTDMFFESVAKDRSGLMQAIVDKAANPKEVAVSLLNVIDTSTREKRGGGFYNKDGQKIEY